MLALTALPLVAIFTLGACSVVPFLGRDPSAARDRASRFDRFADEVLLQIADTAPLLERVALENEVAALAPGLGVGRSSRDVPPIDDARRDVVRGRLLREALARLEDEFAPWRFGERPRAIEARVLRRDIQRILDLDGEGQPLGTSDVAVAPPVISPWSGIPFAAPSVLAREQSIRGADDLVLWKARILRVAERLRATADADSSLSRWLRTTSPARAQLVVAALLDDLALQRPSLGTASLNDPLFGPLGDALQSLRAGNGRRIRFERAELLAIARAYGEFQDRLTAARSELLELDAAPTVAPLVSWERRRWLSTYRDAAGTEADLGVLADLARDEIRRVTLDLVPLLGPSPGPPAETGANEIRASFDGLRDEARRTSTAGATRPTEALWEGMQRKLDKLVAGPHPPILLERDVARPFDRPRGRWAPFVRGDLAHPADPLARPAVYLEPRERDPYANRLLREVEALRYGIPGRGLTDAYRRAATATSAIVRVPEREAFEEGWALYAVAEAAALGVYQPADGGVGWRLQELFALGALLVDIGLHERGWSRDQAVGTLVELTPMSTTEAREAVLRSIAEPGRAALPAIGMLRLRTLRRGVANLLGDDFDAPEFHAALLAGGPIPMSEIDRRIEVWLASREETPR